MKIGIIQTSPVTGDFSGNLRTIVQGYRECLDRGAELIVASSLALCGHQPMDLAARQSFIMQTAAALDALSQEVSSVPLILGATREFEPEEVESSEDDDAWVEDEPVEGAAARSMIGISPYLLEKDTVTLIEEDTVHLDNGMRVHVECSSELSLPVEEDFNILVKLPLAPWFQGELEASEEDRAWEAGQFDSTVVCVRAVGSQEGEVYAGGSTVHSPDGVLRGRLPLFGAKNMVVDTEKARPVASLPEPMEQVRQALVSGIREHVNRCGFGSVCLGLSGGVDSALVAALAVEALGPENVYGLAMPSEYSSESSIEDAYALAANLGIFCKTVPVTPVFDAVRASMAELFEGTEPDKTEENMQSRIRGLFLMSYANKFGHMLLNTGNKSEALVGYCTMYGDTNGGLSPIASLYKTEVYRLCALINAEREIIPQNTIDKAPSAELAPGQKDQDNLPPYEVLDAILAHLVDRNIPAGELLADPECPFKEEDVRRVQRLVIVSAWKRAQLPPVLHAGSCPADARTDIPVMHRLND